jgi:biotin carboxylase
MILVFTHPGDATCAPVVERLVERGAAHAVLDHADLMRRWWVKTSFCGGRARLVLEREHDAIAGKDVGAVLVRRPGRVEPPAIDDARVAAYVAEEVREHLAGLSHLLDAFWLPARPHHVTAMQYKPPQLAVAQRLGFDVPDTLIPTTADDVIAFWEAHRGRVVCKPLGPTAFLGAFGTEMVRYAEPMSRRQLAHAGSVARCPVILQAYVEKRAELRVTVVGDRAFAAEIASQDSNHTRTDWRKYDRHATAYRPYALPPELAARCVAMVETLGLAYGAIDLILDEDGRFVFLELNPTGEYNFVEVRAGLRISEAIADLLIARDRAHEEHGHARATR